MSEVLEIGEGFVGAGAEAAHVNTVLGPRQGPVGAAFATALATPSVGHAPFVVVLRPSLAVKPPTRASPGAPRRRASPAASRTPWPTA
jgi:5,6,7,8-tetrahydromethanopterin hydro-lyase